MNRISCNLSLLPARGFQDTETMIHKRQYDDKNKTETIALSVSQVWSMGTKSNIYEAV